MRKVNRAIKILLIFLFTLQVSLYLFQPLLAVFITEFIPGATLSIVGFAAAFVAVTKSIVQVPTARLLDKRIGERDDFYVMVAGSTLGTIATFAYLIVETIWHLFAVSMVAGVASGLLMSAYYSIFSHHVDGDAQGFEWSLFSAGGLTISSAIGGALGGLLVEATSFQTTFFIAGVISFVSAIMLLSLYPLLDGFRKVIEDPEASFGVEN